ncbi:hypothetical protein DTL21_12835 [Bremerella cremea]|uniref:Uncharacterized protein n=1 Tax=Blastopirellula marina TaxID=124 RepID=A0A2S8FQE3_9BACT|nr:MULTISPECIES: hypothetical protein [Pirellulaceae]PQO34406.1 hypothetical protein C5Y83_12830 [Blastopirellula marina]RCS46902.1 hypothetical protein DTL21_12835 [Bremerella cremea]
MNCHEALSTLKQHSPLPSDGTYDVATFEAISQALSALPRCSPSEVIPALLMCADSHSDERLLSGAAHVLANFPLNVLQPYLADLSSQNRPAVWLLAIFDQLPQFASQTHLQQMRASATDDEVCERIDAEIKRLCGDDTDDEVDATMTQFKRQQNLPQVCEKADAAFRLKDFVVVIRLLTPYQEILPKAYQHKLQIARRKVAN